MSVLGAEEGARESIRDLETALLAVCQWLELAWSDHIEIDCGLKTLKAIKVVRNLRVRDVAPVGKNDVGRPIAKPLITY